MALKFFFQFLLHTFRMPGKCNNLVWNILKAYAENRAQCEGESRFLYECNLGPLAIKF